MPDDERFVAEMRPLKSSSAKSESWASNQPPWRDPDESDRESSDVTLSRIDDNLVSMRPDLIPKPSQTRSCAVAFAGCTAGIADDDAAALTAAVASVAVGLVIVDALATELTVGGALVEEVVVGAFAAAGAGAATAVGEPEAAGEIAGPEIAGEFPPIPPCPGGVGSVAGNWVSKAPCTSIRSKPVMAPLA